MQGLFSFTLVRCRNIGRNSWAADCNSVLTLLIELQPCLSSTIVIGRLLVRRKSRRFLAFKIRIAGPILVSRFRPTADPDLNYSKPRSLPSFSAALTLDARPEPCMLRLLSPLSRDLKLVIEGALSPCLTLVCRSMLLIELDVLLVATSCRSHLLV